MSKDTTDDEIRKKIGKYEESLPDSERNPNPEETVRSLIELSAQPLPAEKEQQKRADDYTDRQTHSRKAEDTSDLHSDMSRLKNASTDPKNPR